MIETVTIGSLTLNSGAYALTAAPGLDFPSVRSFAYDLPGTHFGVHTASFYGRRAFSLEGMVIGSSAADMLARRAALVTALDLLSGEQVITFTLSDSTQKRITAIVTGLDAAPRAGIASAVPFAAHFQAAFPYLESATEYSQSTGPALPGGGTVPPPAMPMALSQGTGGSIFAANLGNAPAFPTARIAGPVTNPAIRNDTDAIELRFTVTLGDGEYLDIDFRRKTITDQDGVNRYSTKTGEWFSLAPGTTNIRLITDSTDTEASLALDWRDTYLHL